MASPSPGSRSARPRAESVPRRIARAWPALAPEQRLAALASLGLFVTMFLPWYSRATVTQDRAGKLQSATQSLSAFGDFSWVEAAVLLVALAVLWMLFARAERRAFHLPGGDGMMILLAGAWTALLVAYRLLDKPGTKGSDALKVTIGVRWGIFAALAAAGMLAYAGSRVRHAHRPEPPLQVPEPDRHPRVRARGTTPTSPLADEPTRPAPDPDATAQTRIERGPAAPEDPTTALPRRHDG